jgi:hypothetical protein
MPNIIITANTRTAFNNADAGPDALVNWIAQIAAGQIASEAMWYSRNDDTALGDTAYAGQAAGLFILSASAAGVVSADVCGATISVNAGASPGAANSIVAQTAWCLAVRSSATINQKVTAVNRCATITLSTVLATQSVQVCGEGFTAASGTPSTLGTFDIAGNDTADALSLATAINRHPALCGRVRAVSVAGVVYVGLNTERTPDASDAVVSFAATMVVANASFASVAQGMVFATTPGVIGNECRFVTAAGTGASLATNGTAGLLGGGTGGGTSVVQVIP